MRVEYKRLELGEVVRDDVEHKPISSSSNLCFFVFRNFPSRIKKTLTRANHIKRKIIII